MRNDELRLTWNYGRSHMTVYMKKFFPCSLKSLRTLLKTVRIDEQYNVDHIQHILNFLNEEVKAWKIKKPGIAKAFDRNIQYVDDYNRIICGKRHPNGEKLTKVELMDYREKRNYHSKIAREKKREYAAGVRRCKQIKKNIEQLMKVR